METLDQLNSQQKEAVLSNSQYIRIIAGAGSGKTRVLTMRMARLIEEQNVFPSHILAITFTNKAANEMKERMNKMLQDRGSGVHISTIHSLCVRILREDIMAINLPRNFTVMDSDDQKTILREAYKEIGIDAKTFSLSSMLDYISNNKAARISKERATELAGNLSGEMSKARVYAYYINRQKAMFALDFDDLLLETVRLFHLFPEVLAKWQKRFHYIHVDEFQDIDEVQYELISQLSGHDNHLCVVGDPDQTIYTWRGANVNIIMNFEKDFHPCVTIVLNENYRSLPSILNGANSLIKYNQNRVEKDLFTNKQGSTLITHYTSAGEEYEAIWISDKIKAMHDEGSKYRDVAILYRSNYLSRAIEKGLLDAHIPYIIYGGTRFYERAEIKDALCYLRMVSNQDDLALMRIINNPRRGVGTKTLDTLRSAAQNAGCSMFEILANQQLFSGRVQQTLNEFVSMINKWKETLADYPIFNLLEKVLEQSGYRAMLEENHETERLENLKELINDIQSFQVNYPESSLEEYLQMVSLYGDKSDYENGDYIQLMTVHAAKGLEFDTVFVCGMSDGVFPSDRSMQDGRKGLEEERRLAYVAYTRARNKLFLTECQGFSFILSRVRTRSRFIDEVDETCIEHIGSIFQENKPQDRSLSSLLFEKEASFDERMDAKERLNLRKGDRIIHDTFKEGIVVSIKEGLAEIAFGFPYGVKKLMANHPSIKKQAKELK